MTKSLRRRDYSGFGIRISFVLHHLGIRHSSLAPHSSFEYADSEEAVIRVIRGQKSQVDPLLALFRDRSPKRQLCSRLSTDELRLLPGANHLFAENGHVP
jgi:hypothetical protein